MDFGGFALALPLHQAVGMKLHAAILVSIFATGLAHAHKPVVTAAALERDRKADAAHHDELARFARKHPAGKELRALMRRNGYEHLMLSGWGDSKSTTVLAVSRPLWRGLRLELGKLEGDGSATRTYTFVPLKGTREARRLSLGKLGSLLEKTDRASRRLSFTVFEANYVLKQESAD